MFATRLLTAFTAARVVLLVAVCFACAPVLLGLGAVSVGGPRVTLRGASVVSATRRGEGGRAAAPGGRPGPATLPCRRFLAFT